MPTYSKGDLVVVLYPFSDGSGRKPRPAVVVSDDVHNQQTRDIVLAQVTANIGAPMRAGDCYVRDWQAANLNAPSKARAGKLVTIEVNEIHKTIGHLSSTDLGVLETNLRLVLGLP